MYISYNKIFTALDAGVANLETGLFTSVHKQCPRCDTQGTQARIPPRNKPMYPRQFHVLGRLNAQAIILLMVLSLDDELKQLWEGVCVKTSNSTSAIIRAALICVACDITAARKVCVVFWDIELLWGVPNVYFHSQHSFLVI